MNWKFFNAVEEIKQYLAKNGIEPVSVTSFGQNWPGTNLGFGGAGGNTLTSSQTTIIESYIDDKIMFHVFFDDRIAYSIVNPNDKFFKDMCSHHMLPVWDKYKYDTPKDDLDDVKESFPESMLTPEQISIVKNMPRPKALKYIKENEFGFDGLTSAAIYYDLYINKD